MAKKKKARKAPRKLAKCAKGKRGAACRRKRRGIGATFFEERMNRLDAEREAAGWTAMQPAPTPAQVEKSKDKAADKGCKAPKGKVCVDASVGRVGKNVRRGCKKSRSTPGTYVCTQAAVKAHASGKNVRAGKYAGKGIHVTSWKRAVNKSNGLFNKGCHYSFRMGRPVCRTKSKRAA